MLTIHGNWFECTDLALTSQEQAQDVETGNVPSGDE